MSDRPTIFRVGDADRGKRLDRYLAERIPAVSRVYIQRAIRSRVELSWRAEAVPSARVQPGGRVVVGFSPLEEVPSDLPVPVLLRGEGWLVVDKPPGVPVHPTNSVRENSLIRMLRRQEGKDVRLVHRLDRETSGALLIAEGAAAAGYLSAAFRGGRIRKEYLAVVRGSVEKEEGVVDGPIAGASGSKVFVRRQVGPGGQEAITRWRVERRIPHRNLTVLRLFPLTGRRHQLRVHLAHLGHPILGDLLYGRPDRDYLDLLTHGRDARREEGGPDRHLLHCARLSFREPGGAEGTVDAPLPADFQEALAG